MKTDRERLVCLEENRWIVFDTGAPERYDVDAGQFTTEEGHVHWLAHLSRKPWFTGAHQRQLLQILREKFGARECPL